MDFLPPDLSCNDDPGCIRCLQSLEDGAYLKNPPWRANLYRALRPFTELPEGKIPVQRADALRSAIAKVPTGRLFTDEVRERLEDRMKEWKKARANKGTYVPRATELLRHLSHAANLIDLDLLLPKRLVPRSDKDGSVAFGGLLRLKTRHKRSLAAVRAKVVSDALAPLPRALVSVSGLALADRSCR